MPPCGCNQSQPQQFVHTAPDGRQTIYHTETQARAAVIRMGGSMKPR